MDFLGAEAAFAWLGRALIHVAEIRDLRAATAVEALGQLHPATVHAHDAEHDFLPRRIRRAEQGRSRERGHRSH